MGITDQNAVIITGGSGLLGHHLPNNLARKNCSVHIIDNLSKRNNAFLRDMNVNRILYDNVLLAAVEY